jgi:hypothetical protein
MFCFIFSIFRLGNTNQELGQGVRHTVQLLYMEQGAESLCDVHGWVFLAVAFQDRAHSWHKCFLPP